MTASDPIRIDADATFTLADAVRVALDEAEKARAFSPAEVAVALLSVLQHRIDNQPGFLAESASEIAAAVTLLDIDIARDGDCLEAPEGVSADGLRRASRELARLVFGVAAALVQLNEVG